MTKITCKTFTGTVHEVDVDLEKTVGDLKAQLATITMSSAATMRLIFSGRVLDDSSATLSSLEIKEGSSLHLIQIAAAAEPAASTPAAEPQSLFSGPTPSSSSGGSSGSSGSSGGGGGGPSGIPPELAQMLGTPQGQQMMVAALRNPAILQRLAQDPQIGPQIRQLVQLIQSDPAAFQQMMMEMSGGGGGGRPYPAIPREIFDDAFPCLTGAPVPAQYSRGPGPHRARGEWREFVSRDKINAALDGIFGASPASASAAPAAAAAAAGTTAAADGAGPAMETAADDAAPAAEPAAADPATGEPAAADPAAGGMETAADPAAPAAADPAPTADPAPAEPASGGGGGAMETAAEPADGGGGGGGGGDIVTPDKLAQLAAMGFTMEPLCRQALEAANGDVGMAVVFLSSMQ